MSDIYVVIGWADEYSDRDVWVSCCVTTEEGAKKLVVEYTKASSEIHARFRLPADHPLKLNRHRREQQWKELHPDKKFQAHGLSETRYYFERVELITAGGG